MYIVIPTMAVALLQVTLFIIVFPKNGSNDTHWYMPHWFQESSIIKYLSMSLIIYNVTFILLLAGSIESLFMCRLLFKHLNKSAYYTALHTTETFIILVLYSVQSSHASCTLFSETNCSSYHVLCYSLKLLIC